MKNGIDSKEYDLDAGRVFYKGKELKDKHPVGQYNIESEGVLQLFIRKKNL